MILGYNTNGFAHHWLSDALEIMADLGYRGVALTPDVNHLNFFRDLDGENAAAFRQRADKLHLACVIETGARFLLDPKRKHHPTFMSSQLSERIVRRDFLQLAVAFSPIVGAKIVSFWSGKVIDNATSPN